MGKIVSILPRKVLARGLKLTSLPSTQRIKEYLLPDEYKLIFVLQKLPTFPHQQVTLLYPGCGTDILFPLLYLEKLFPKLEKAQFLFVDVYDLRDAIKTILDDIGVSFAEDNHLLQFYWKGKLITLTFIEKDIFQVQLPAFNVYFERAFRIMKDGHENYEQRVFEKLAKGGILMSDSGFKDVPLRRMKVPQELSAYGEMVLGVKE